LAKQLYELWTFEQHHKIEKKTLLGMLEGNIRQIPYCLAVSTLILLISEMLKMSEIIFFNQKFVKGNIESSSIC
jgi:hypothetical protein